MNHCYCLILFILFLSFTVHLIICVVIVNNKNKNNKKKCQLVAYVKIEDVKSVVDTKTSRNRQ